MALIVIAITTAIYWRRGDDDTDATVVGAVDGTEGRTHVTMVVTDESATVRVVAPIFSMSVRMNKSGDVKKAFRGLFADVPAGRVCVKAGGPNAEAYVDAIRVRLGREVSASIAATESRFVEVSVYA